jgi:hypothetical protein
MDCCPSISYQIIHFFQGDLGGLLFYGKESGYYIGSTTASNLPLSFFSAPVAIVCCAAVLALHWMMFTRKHAKKNLMLLLEDHLSPGRRAQCDLVEVKKVYCVLTSLITYLQTPAQLMSPYSLTEHQ